LGFWTRENGKMRALFEGSDKVTNPRYLVREVSIQPKEQG